MYRFMSPKSEDVHELEQWDSRSLAGELQSFEDRTLVRVFNRYLDGKQVRVLEGGCGLGAWCHWFEQRNHEVVGLEHNQHIVEQAKRYKPDIAVEFGDVTQIPYPDNSFDVYVSLGVIEHFERGPQLPLKEAFRILKPDGLAFVSTPYLSPIRRLFSHPVRDLYFATNRLRGRPAYFWEYRFTQHELESYLSEAGFKILSTEVDDYDGRVTDRHMGLWTDWFFMRQMGGRTWALNKRGRMMLGLLRPLPRSWYSAGIVTVAQAQK